MSPAVKTNKLTAQDLRPNRDIIQQASLKALAGRVKESQVLSFSSKAASAKSPSPIKAIASVAIAVWGKLRCAPDGVPWTYDITVWGGPGYFGESSGFLYTAYAKWDTFFQNVTSAHVQGVVSGAGFLQINWLNKSGTPVGQFNGLAGGIGLLEAAGSGAWKKKKT